MENNKLDKAEEEYANKEYPDEPSVGQWGTGDYEPPIDREYLREIAKDAFKAGAKWMAEQGVNLEATIENHPELVRNSGDHHLLVVKKIDETTNKLPEGKYIVQIRKAE